MTCRADAQMMSPYYSGGLGIPYPMGMGGMGKSFVPLLAIQPQLFARIQDGHVSRDDGNGISLRDDGEQSLHVLWNGECDEGPLSTDRQYGLGF